MCKTTGKIIVWIFLFSSAVYQRQGTQNSLYWFFFFKPVLAYAISKNLKSVGKTVCACHIIGLYLHDRQYNKILAACFKLK